MKILIIGATGMLGSSIFLTETNNDLIGTYLGNKPKSDKIAKKNGFVLERHNLELYGICSACRK